MKAPLLSVNACKGDEAKSRVLIMFKLFVVVNVNSASALMGKWSLPYVAVHMFKTSAGLVSVIRQFLYAYLARFSVYKRSSNYSFHGP